MTQTAKPKLYDGSSHILYWADALSEIAFVVPSQLQPRGINKKDLNTSNLSCKKCLLNISVLLILLH